MIDGIKIIVDSSRCFIECSFFWSKEGDFVQKRQYSFFPFILCSGNMGFLSIMGNSIGCSASGERLVSAARDGDVQEAKALLDYNPRLARYSTFGGRNSPLHYSAAKGHHEIVSLLIESGVDINLRNSRGQTALMQACLYGHWEVVQILMLFNANIHRMDYLSGGTALHFAALNGHTRCIRLLLADYVPSTPDFWNIVRRRLTNEASTKFEEITTSSTLSEIVNRRADGGITALHMAALNGHVESVQLLLDLGACVSEVTVEDGTTIDLIGARSTPLHYAACGGNAVCCQILIARGASLTAKNANGWTPLMVARSWHKNWLEGILSKQPEGRTRVLPSPYLALPLMSIVRIAREYGWRKTCQSPACVDPCVICLESRCTVAAEGCAHEFCTRCALYLCSTGSISTVKRGPPGSIACPLCRHAIFSFVKLTETSPTHELPKVSLPLSICTTGSGSGLESATSVASQLCKAKNHCSRTPLGSSSFRSLSLQKFPSMKLNSTLCMEASETRPCLVRRSRGGLKRSASYWDGRRRPWLFSFNQYLSSSGDS
ncbi:probable E3 ubiquitin-protein ligase XBOS32 isoform X2 [Elaeis guineensis]|uniref:RING-type E3 ubiquitin transferase n=1 Tax=Elaeis guineensis var. tenera TaxID=51953 RepID=A0A6I9RM59_ELAGV|nr:probable E3 ubiquitin-protein ligase XBOS32 isoform X2 [Elaeis guineensis]